jgi:AraC-like DNA-binding protein
MQITTALPARERPLRATLDGPDAFNGLFDVVSRPCLVAEAAARTTISSTRNFALSNCLLRNYRLSRPPQPRPGDGLDLFAFVLQANGVSSESQLQICDLAQPCDIDALDPAGVYALTILWVPRSRVLRAFTNELALQNLKLSTSLPAIDVLAAALCRFQERAGVMMRDEFDATAAGLAELAASAVNERLKGALGPALGAPLSSFISIRRFIDQNLTASGLNADKIADAFGLSRATIYRLFEPVGGVSAYIRKARLARAHQEITAPQNANKRTGHIAMRLGFPSANAFTRAFQEAYGVAPTQARKNALDAIAGEHQVIATDASASIARFLKQMHK